MKNSIVALCVLAVSGVTLFAADPTEKSGAGTFVSYKDGTLTIKSKADFLIYKQVGDNYRTYQDNENGPGSRRVETIEALGRVLPGTVIHVNVAEREISFGLDHRVIGTFVSYQDDKLSLVAAEVSQGFVKRPTGNVAMTVDRNTPVLESVKGGDYQFAGRAGEILKTVKKGTMVTARSEYDPDIIEVIQLGEPKRRIERYIGQTRGTVRGTFVSFKDGVLRIRGKGVTALAANEYERVIAVRITNSIPILESIDGGEYKPTGGAETLTILKEGTIVTIRKVEEVILDIQVGVPKKK